MMMLNPVKSGSALSGLGMATTRPARPGPLPFCAICNVAIGGAGAVATRSAFTSGPMPCFVPKDAGNGRRGGGGNIGGADDPETVSWPTDDRGGPAGAPESGGVFTGGTGQKGRICTRGGRVLGTQSRGSNPLWRTPAVLQRAGCAAFPA